MRDANAYVNEHVWTCVYPSVLEEKWKSTEPANVDKVAEKSCIHGVPSH
jgi:hypothetical protein